MHVLVIGAAGMIGRKLVARIASLRVQKARLLGHASWADYVLEERMARTAEAAVGLLRDMVPAATARARAEAERIQREIDAGGAGFRLGPADWEFYAERVRLGLVPSA